MGQNVYVSVVLIHTNDGRETKLFKLFGILCFSDPLLSKVIDIEMHISVLKWS